MNNKISGVVLTSPLHYEKKEKALIKKNAYCRNCHCETKLEVFETIHRYPDDKNYYIDLMFSCNNCNDCDWKVEVLKTKDKPNFSYLWSTV